MTTSPNRTYVPEIDQLRGFAASLVFLYHGFQIIGARLAYGATFDPARHWVVANNPMISMIEEGHSGVGLFIVLSGFVLSLGAIDRKLNYRQFLIARTVRIYPILIVFCVTAASLQPTSITSFLATLLPFNALDGLHGNFVAMFWAVAVEFQCYLAFPFLILFSRQNGIRFLLQVIVAAFALRAIAVFAEGANARDISYWTVIGRIDQFCIGLIAARLYVIHDWRSKIKFFMFFPAALIVVLVLWAFNHAGGWPSASDWKLAWPDAEGVMWALFLLCYLRTGQSLHRRIAGPLTRLGEVSYSFYIVHFVVLNLCVTHAVLIHITGAPYYDALLSTALIAGPIAFGLAVLLYKTIELPFLQLRPRYVEPHSPPMAMPRRS